MGELVLLKSGDKSVVPKHIQQYQDDVEQAKGLVTTSVGGDRVSIKGKQFRFIRDGEEVAKLAMGVPLNAVIIGIDPEKGLSMAYYKEAYNPDSDSIPDCFSSDGIKPDPNCESAQSDACATCKWNAFGSGTDATGAASKGKACGDHKNLFILASTGLNDEIWRLSVPATSLKALTKYGRILLEHKVPMFAIQTQIAFNEDAVHPQLEFEPLEYLSAEEADICRMRSKSSDLELMQPSKNIIATSAPAKSALPSPPPNIRKVMTEKAKGITLEAYKNNGWDEEQLLEHGLMEIHND